MKKFCTGAWRTAIVSVVACSLAGLSLGAMVACGKETIVAIKEPEKCTLQIVGMSIIASPRINPTDNGEPRPVQLRIYQLKTDSRLMNAEFDEIWKDDKKILQDDLVKVDELSVFPDTRTEIKFERDPSALVVAAVALFRNHKGKTWWHTWELPPAPGKGECGMPKCTGPSCEGGDAGDAGKEPPNLNPKFYVWIDGTRVDEGEDHADEFPDGGRTQEILLRGKSSSGAPAAGGATK